MNGLGRHHSPEEDEEVSEVQLSGALFPDQRWETFIHVNIVNVSSHRGGKKKKIPLKIQELMIKSPLISFFSVSAPSSCFLFSLSPPEDRRLTAA